MILLQFDCHPVRAGTRRTRETWNKRRRERHADMKRVATSKLRAGMVASESVFVPEAIIPIVHEDTILSNHMIDLFKMHGIQSVLVDGADEVDGDVEASVPSLPIIKPIINEKLRDEALDSIRRMFTVVKAGDSEENMTTAYQAVKEIGIVVDELVETLTAESSALVHIAGIKSYDDYTYHHSLSVAVLSIAIGRNLGLPEEALKVLGRSAMLHDIGKILVPVDLINKPGRLSDTEFRIIQQHPELGREYLAKLNAVDDNIRAGVLLHHEKLDGTGYPGGRKGRDLPFISRVIGIADVYDAVTSYRAYRKPMPPAEALELIMGEPGFDHDIVKAFIDKLEPYPLNTRIELSNKKHGIVLENTHSKRPTIKLLETGETLDLMSMKNLNIVITGVDFGK